MEYVSRGWRVKCRSTSEIEPTPACSVVDPDCHACTPPPNEQRSVPHHATCGMCSATQPSRIVSIKYIFYPHSARFLFKQSFLHLTISSFPPSLSLLCFSISFAPPYATIIMLLRRGQNRWLVLYVATVVSFLLVCFYGDTLASLRRMAITWAPPSSNPSKPLITEPNSPLYSGDAEVELVVAATQKDNITWLNDYLLAWPKNIYSVDNPKAELTVPKNKGREAMVILTYEILSLPLPHYNRKKNYITKAPLPSSHAGPTMAKHRKPLFS